MNIILKHLKDFDTWIIYERSVLDAYWIVSMHDTREGVIAMLERVAK